MRDKFFCDSKLTLHASRPYSLPIGTSVRINPNEVLRYVEILTDWFKLLGNDEDVFTIVRYSG